MAPKVIEFLINKLYAKGWFLIYKGPYTLLKVSYNLTQDKLCKEDFSSFDLQVPLAYDLQLEKPLLSISGIILCFYHFI